MAANRACPVRSIASGFFAHISLVIDGLIRCDDGGALPAVRISDDNTKQPNFYLDRRGDDLYGYFFEPCTAAALPKLPAWVPLARPLPPQPEKELRRMWMRARAAWRTPPRRTRGGTRRTHWPMWPTWC